MGFSLRQPACHDPSCTVYPQVSREAIRKHSITFWKLSPAERDLLISALGMLLLLRLGLWLLSLARVLAWMQGRTVDKAFRGQTPPPNPARIASPKYESTAKRSASHR